MLKGIGSSGLGAVGVVGNFLDLPGSILRDLAAGEGLSGSFDQVLTPFTDENRVSGRQLLERYGMRANRQTGISGWVRDPGEAIRDIAGFGAEVLLDPFGPLAGAAGKAAGLASRIARPAVSAALPRVVNRLPRMAAATQSIHPLVYGLGRAAKVAFDPLSPTGRRAFETAFSTVRRVKNSLFDKYGWGVTDPVVQPIAARVREAWRVESDQIQARVAAVFLKMEQMLNFRMTVDQTLDMTNPANLTAEGSPLRVAANKEAIAKYLEDVTGLTPVGNEYWAPGDLVTVGLATGDSPAREIERVERTATGLKIFLTGDPTEYDESMVTEVFRKGTVRVPAGIRPELDAIKAMQNQARALAEHRGLQVPTWRDAYADFTARNLSDSMRYARAASGGDPSEFRRSFGQTTLEATLNPGARQAKYGGFKQGAHGVNELFRDPSWEKLHETMSPLVTSHLQEIPATGTPGVRAAADYMHEFVGLSDLSRTLEIGPGAPTLPGLAEVFGMSPEELWGNLSRLANNPTGSPYATLPISLDSTVVRDQIPAAVAAGMISPGYARVVLQATPTASASGANQLLITPNSWTDKYGNDYAAAAADPAVYQQRLDQLRAGLDSFKVPGATSLSPGLQAANIEALVLDLPVGAGDAFAAPLGFTLERPSATGELWSRPVFGYTDQPARPGHFSSFPAYMPVKTFMDALSRLRRLHRLDGPSIATRTPAAVHAVGLRHSQGYLLFADTTRSGRNYELRYAPPAAGTTTGVVPLNPDDTPMLLVTPQNVDALWQSQSTATRKSGFSPDEGRRVADQVRNGQTVYFGMAGRTDGGMGFRPVFVRPQTMLEHSQYLDEYEQNVAAYLRPSPLLHLDAARESIFSEIHKKYSDRIEELMPDWEEYAGGALPVQQVSGQLAQVHPGTSLPEWYTQAQQLVVDYFVQGSRQTINAEGMALLRMNDASLAALGLTQRPYDPFSAVVAANPRYAGSTVARTFQDFFNEIRQSLATRGNPVLQDATIPLTSRYKALADELAQNSEKRMFGVYGNNPIVDAADYTTRTTMAANYMDGLYGGLTELAKTQIAQNQFIEATPTGYLSRQQSRQGSRLKDLLDETKPGALLEGRINRRTFYDRLLESMHAEGILTDPNRGTMLSPTGAPLTQDEIAQIIDNQKTLLSNLWVPKEFNDQMRTFAESGQGLSAPELQGILRYAANAMTAVKSGYLTSISTAVRDGFSSLFNAVMIGDTNPLQALTYGKAGLSFSRGAPVDPSAYVGQIPEVESLLTRLGWTPNAQNRGRAFQALWAAHHRAPSRHSNIELAELESRITSGQAERVLDAVPRRGAGQVQGPLGTLADAILGTGRDLATLAAEAASAPGAWNPLSPNNLYFPANPLLVPNVAGMYVRESAERTGGAWVRQKQARPARLVTRTGEQAVQQYADLPRDVIFSNEQRVVQKATGAPIPEAINTLRGMVDTTVRFSVVMEQLAKQRTLSQAFAYADKVLTNADPRNFSRFERVYGRTFAPFYSFMRQSLPMFMTELALNPGGKFGQVIRATRLSQGQDEGYVPFSLQDTAAIPIGTYNDGRAKFLTSLGLMHEDSIKYAGNMLEGDIRALLQQLVASSNPAAKLIVEQATNTSLFSATPMGNRRLDDLDPTLGRIATNLGITELPDSGRATPVGGNFVENLAAASPASRVLSQLRILTNPAERSTPAEKVARLILGVKVETVQPEQTLREIRDRMNALQIKYGARPLTLTTGTRELRDKLAAEGATEEAAQLDKIAELLSALRKQERLRAKQAAKN